MLDGLIGGRLVGKASERIGPSDKPYVTAKVRTPLGDGDSIFVGVIAFPEPVRAATKRPAEAGLVRGAGNTALRHFAFVRRRRATTRPASPLASSARVPGSGTVPVTEYRQLLPPYICPKSQEAQ